MQARPAILIFLKSAAISWSKRKNARHTAGRPRYLAGEGGLVGNQTGFDTLLKSDRVDFDQACSAFLGALLGRAFGCRAGLAGGRSARRVAVASATCGSHTRTSGSASGRSSSRGVGSRSSVVGVFTAFNGGSCDEPEPEACWLR